MPLPAHRQSKIQRIQRVLQMRGRAGFANLVEQAQRLLHQRGCAKQTGVLAGGEWVGGRVHGRVRFLDCCLRA